MKLPPAISSFVPAREAVIGGYYEIPENPETPGERNRIRTNHSLNPEISQQLYKEYITNFWMRGAGSSTVQKIRV